MREPDITFPRRDACPLTPSLRTLLNAAVTLRTTNNRRRAVHLGVSEEAVKSGSRRIGLLCDTHSRSETLLAAIPDGWIALPPTDGAPDESTPIWGERPAALPAPLDHKPPLRNRFRRRTTHDDCICGASRANGGMR